MNNQNAIEILGGFNNARKDMHRVNKSTEIDLILFKGHRDGN